MIAGEVLVWSAQGQSGLDMWITFTFPIPRIDELVFQGISMSQSKKQTWQQFACPGITSFG